MIHINIIFSKPWLCEGIGSIVFLCSAHEVKNCLKQNKAVPSRKYVKTNGNH